MCNNTVKEQSENFILDYNFHYSFVCRNLIINKFYLNSYKQMNSHNLCQFKNINLTFAIKKLEDIDSLSTSNYFFFTKYFLGKKMFISKYQSTFNRGTYYHSFLIQIHLRKDSLFFFLTLFANEIFPFVNKNFIKIKFHKNKILILFSDMSYFTEKKNNVGFYNLKHPMHIKIDCTGLNTKTTKKCFLTFMKIKN